ncbi:MAG: HEAT repeat domain-containing protein [Chloroflexota bacterium]
MLAAKQKQVKERQQARLEKEARQKQETLERLLEDLDEPENHDFAIYRLNQLGEVAIKPLIETLLQDDDPDARYGSARALGQICHEQAIKVLIKARAAKALMQALKDSEPAVRYWSAEALGKFTGQTAENAIDPLIPLLKDSHKGVAAQARRSLVAIGGPRAEEALEKSKRFFNWLK